MTFYFWPQGHPAIPSIGFPAFATPHVEMYTAAGKQVGYLDSTGAQSFSKTCKHTADQPARWSGGSPKTISSTMLVNCTFKVVPEMKAAKSGGGGLLTVTLGHTTTTVLTASMKATGSKLTYDSRYCKTTPAPTPPPAAKPARYSFSGLTVSFDAQSLHVTYTFSGTMCGDPATTAWALSTVLSVTPNPINSNFVLRPGVPTAVSAFATGNPEVGRITMSLTYTSPPAQMAATTQVTGAITNVQAGAPAAVTVTPVNSCT